MGERRTYAYEKYEKKYAAAARRKRRWNTFGVMLCALAVMAIIVYSHTFSLQEINVTGNSSKSDSEIAGLSGLKLGMNILRVNKEEVRKNFADNTYVELLDITIKLPNAVSLKIKERSVRAAINCAGVILLIDEDGYILNKMNTLPASQNILLVSGMELSVSSQGRTLETENNIQLRDMKRLLDAIYAFGMEKQISELNVSDSDNLYLVSQSGIQVLLGDSELLDEKLTWTRAVLDTLTAEGVMRGVLDVSTATNAVYADR